MAYIGQQPVVGRYILLDQISGGFNGTTSGFTMSTAGGVQGVKPGLAQNVLLSLGGVIQQPGVDYTISGSGITFTTPPVSGTTFFATVLGDAQSVGTPSDGTVTPASIAAGYDFAFPNVNVTGVTTIASGVAATPSLSITGDADTGIFSPAADTLGFATAGVQRLSIETGEVVVNDGSSDVDFRVESNGNANMLFVDGGNDRVGIGTSSPNQTLKVVKSSSGGTVIEFSDNVNATGRLGTPSNQVVSFGGNTNHSIAFGGYSTDGSTFSAERMRIDTSGRLLVGTSSSKAIGTSTDGILQVAKTSHAIAAITTYENSTSGGTLILGKSRAGSIGGNTIVQDGDTLGEIRFAGADGTDINSNSARITSQVDGTPGSDDMPGRLVFSTTADGASSVTERMRINSSGNVGIKSTNPLAQLHILNTSGTSGFYVSRANGTAVGDQISIQLSTDSSKPRITGYGDGLTFFTASTGGTASERLRIDSSGRLNIGTTSNSYTDARLQANTSNGSFFVTRYSHLLVQNKDDSTTDWWNIAPRSNGSLTIGNGVPDSNGIVSDQKFVIDSGGDVGIGTTSPGARLELRDNTQALLSWGDTAAIGSLSFDGSSQPVVRALSGKSLVFQTNGSNERMRIDSSGRLLVGISSARANFLNSTFSARLQVEGTGHDNSAVSIVRNSNDGGSPYLNIGKSRSSSVNGNTVVQSGDGLGVISFQGTDGSEMVEAATIIAQVDGTPGANDMPGRLVFQTTADGASSTTERMRIDSSGFVGINCTPRAQLEVKTGTDANILMTTMSSEAAIEVFNDAGNANVPFRLRASEHKFFTSGTERFRISSSGRLSGGDALNPTGDAAANYLTIQANYNGNTAVNITGNSGNTSQSGTYALRLRQNVDNNQGNSAILRIDHTNPLGASGGEIAQIFSNAGNSTLQKIWVVHRDGKQDINRPASDGTLISFRQNDTQEGTISVSGSSVSYNGGHLARWSQLEGGAERTEILRGSVLSNLDEMCEWIKPDTEELLWTQEDLDMYLLNGDEGLPGGAQVGDVKEPATSGVREDNEQLNRMKVSDVEGDVNVAGVFQCWDDDDDTYTNDFYCAMTGDFVIRIAQGTTVARGDLLMSAGDGTAKPQDDDIVRSKTIAKVTSTTVSTTYADGSYCVPCVLMAC